MTSQCPRCLSSMFKPLIAGDGNRANCCDFCKDSSVHHTRIGDAGRHRLVRLEPREQPTNVVPLNFKDNRAQPR